MTTQNSTFQKPFEAAAGPWTNLSQAHGKQMDAAFLSAAPMLQALARVQLEWAQLALSRGRAWAALPADVSRCKSPADLATLQFNFWQTAGRTYAQGWQRVIAASTTLAAQSQSAGAEAARRDILEVPDEEHAGRSRHAA